MILPISWFIDYVPLWLSPTLALLGALFLIIGVSQVITKPQPSIFSKSNPVIDGVLDDDHTVLSDAKETPISHTLFYIGSFAIALPALKENIEISMFFVLFIGKFLEGVASIRIYIKIRYAVNNTELPPGAGILTKVGREILLLFLLSTGIFVCLIATIYSIAQQGDPIYEVAVIWTVTTSAILLLSYFWKIKSSRVFYTSSIHLYGIVLLITGAEIYNFHTLGTEILATGVGLAGQLVGQIFASIWLLGGHTEDLS
jgi:hypothetical protein